MNIQDKTTTNNQHTTNVDISGEQKTDVKKIPHPMEFHCIAHRNMYYNPTLFQDTIKKMCQGFMQNVNGIQNNVIHDTMSLCTYLIGKKRMTVFDAVEYIHYIVNYYLCPPWMPSKTPGPLLLKRIRKSNGFVTEDQDTYHDLTLYEENIDEIKFDNIEHHLTDLQKIVLNETILLNKDLVENEDITVTQGVYHVFEMVQHFKRCIDEKMSSLRNNSSSQLNACFLQDITNCINIPSQVDKHCTVLD